MLERKIERDSFAARYADEVSLIYSQEPEQLVKVFRIRKGFFRTGRFSGAAQIVADHLVFRRKLVELVSPRSAVHSSSVEEDHCSSAAHHLVVQLRSIHFGNAVLYGRSNRVDRCRLRGRGPRGERRREQ